MSNYMRDINKLRSKKLEALATKLLQTRSKTTREKLFLEVDKIIKAEKILIKLLKQ